MSVIAMVDPSTPGAYLPVPFPYEWRPSDGTTTYGLIEQYAGCVIAEREQNGYNDSDFFALVWDAENQAFKWIEFASTRGWCYPCFGTHVDATPEVIARWDAYCVGWAEYETYLRQEAEKRRPAVGRRVRIVRGRKVPVGSWWWIVSVAPSSFKVGVQRLGLRSDDGKFAWTDQTNAEVQP